MPQGKTQSGGFALHQGLEAVVHQVEDSAVQLMGIDAHCQRFLAEFVRVVDAGLQPQFGGQCPGEILQMGGEIKDLRFSGLSCRQPGIELQIFPGAQQALTVPVDLPDQRIALLILIELLHIAQSQHRREETPDDLPQMGIPSQECRHQVRGFGFPDAGQVGDQEGAFLIQRQDGEGIMGQ